MKKKIIAIGVSIGIVLAAFAIVKALPSGENETPISVKAKAIGVEVIHPEQSDIAYQISSTGKIVAAERFEIFAQVDGQLLSSAKKFKEGKTYNKGEVMLEIEADEFEKTLLAKKSDFITLLTSVLPDLKSDYPDSYQQWRQYALNLDVKSPLPEMPEAKDSQEKFFLSGRGVYSSFYNIQSNEERFEKYVIRAPFNGIVTSTMVEAGKAIRTGTELGQFINPNLYDLEITIPVSAMKDIEVGKQATLHSSEINGTWTGRVTRISGSIDELSQSVKVFIRTTGSNLREGMFLTADLAVSPIENSYNIPRKMLNDNDELYVVENNILKLKKVNVLIRQGDNALVQGISAQDAILQTVIKNAHQGMAVEIIQQ